MITIAVSIGLLAALYLYLTRTFDYWEKRGVRHDKPWPLFGTNMKNYLLKASLMDMATEAYKKYPSEKLVGYFRGSCPELIVRDPAIAKHVLSVDFNSFHRRGFLPASAKKEPLEQNQFSSDDDLWRLLRIRMTPAFSSGKLKAMFPLVLERADCLQQRLHRIVDTGPIDARDLMARFTIDVIGTVGFGVVSNSLTNDNDSMRQLALKLFSANFSRILRFTLKSLMPYLLEHLKTAGSEEQEIIGMVRSIMHQRNWEPSGRHDFIDLLLECKQKGAMTGDSIVETNADGTPKKVSIEMDLSIMAAQSFVFFVAGFETSSAATSYTLHQLAHNPSVQEKVQAEIDSVMSTHSNVLSYDSISEMTYLKWCLDESLRIFPSVGFLQRQCVRPYTFPDTKVTIDAGVNVIIPLAAYQNDSKIFPDPETFRPERFDPAVMTAEQRMAYLPFGGGPRACIGERLGLMQSLAGLAAVLSQFTVSPVPGAPRDPVLDPVSGVIQLIKGDLPLLFRKRTTGGCLGQELHHKSTGLRGPERPSLGST